MTLYSFKGHYPVEVTDNNKGWYEVPAKPEAPEGKQVAWLNGEWVVRDPKPADRPGYQWNWNHSEMAWVECEYPLTAPEVVEPDYSLVITPSDSISLVVDGGFSEPITLAAGSDPISVAAFSLVISDSEP
jgi:hypothetical protein